MTPDGVTQQPDWLDAPSNCVVQFIAVMFAPHEAGSLLKSNSNVMFKAEAGLAVAAASAMTRSRVRVNVRPLAAATASGDMNPFRGLAPSRFYPIR